MQKAVDRIANGVLALLGVGLLGMVLLSVYNVVSRYVFNDALLWADEVAVFGMIAMAYFGAIVCAWRGTEIRMDLLVQMLPKSWQRPLFAVQDLLIAALLLWLAWLSYGYVSRVFQFGMRSDGAGVPTWIVHAVIPACFAAIAIIAIIRPIRALAGKQEPAEILVQKEVQE